MSHTSSFVGDPGFKLDLQQGPRNPPMDLEGQRVSLFARTELSEKQDSRLQNWSWWPFAQSYGQTRFSGIPDATNPPGESPWMPSEGDLTPGSFRLPEAGPMMTPVPGGFDQNFRDGPREFFKDQIPENRSQTEQRLIARDDDQHFIRDKLSVKTAMLTSPQWCNGQLRAYDANLSHYQALTQYPSRLDNVIWNKLLRP
ncbi:hypothetical protein BJV78DRAFT_1283182 [Lactifluus subvellereus]|nr:hypothetical protein BJV78DRAFT_1283182 [Lactifluus subvellereus]